MNRESRVAVCSRSFSKNPTLRRELLERYERVTFNDDGRSLVGDGFVNFVRGHDKAITALETIDASVISRLPELRVISKYGVGLDMLDLAALKGAGVRLGWEGGVNRRSVAELAIAFAIAMLRQVPAANREVLQGVWRQHVGGNLSGRIVGIVGCGHVGKDLATLVRAFGCPVLANDILDFPEFYGAHGVEATSLDDLLERSDVVSLHVPLNASTRGMLDARRLRLLKPTAVLVNTARGGIVDEQALKGMLMSGAIAGAAFDVFSAEPPEDMELLSLPNFLVTPHIGGSSHEAILAMGRAAIRGLDVNDVPA